MKKIILLSSLLLSSGLLATTEIRLTQVDQEILAQLIARLPGEVVRTNTTEIFRPATGLNITYQFPKKDSGFKIFCENVYYYQSPYPSASTCQLSIDEHHPEVDKNYDEFKIMFKDQEATQALFNKISYGKPEKEFRSDGREEGTNFEGKKSFIFHYFFKCSPTSCVLRFSDIIPAPDQLL